MTDKHQKGLRINVGGLFRLGYTLTLTLTQQEYSMTNTVVNKTGLYIVRPDRIGAAPGRPKDAQSNESQKSYYARKYMQARSAQIATKKVTD